MPENKYCVQLLMRDPYLRVLIYDFVALIQKIFPFQCLLLIVVCILKPLFGWDTHVSFIFEHCYSSAAFVIFGMHCHSSAAYSSVVQLQRM